MLRFFTRVGALFGVLLVATGLVFWRLEGTLVNAFSLTGILLGAALIALGVAVNLKAFGQALTSKRGALGLNELILVGLAVLLAGFVNYWAFGHYRRFDWTRDKQFTTPEATAEQLRRLKEPIDIVVYIAHKTFGRADTKPDAIDYAAERKVVEKVRDLVERYGEIGAQVRVQVLDVEEEGYDKKLEELPKVLQEEIAKAAENSILFRSGDHIKRLSFSDYYQLDKRASKAQANLVLRAQGEEAFSRQIFKIDEKKPEIVFAVGHEAFTLESDIPFGLKGLGAALERWGMKGRAVILKDFSPLQRRPPNPPGEPKAIALSYKELRFQQLTDRIRFCSEQIDAWKERVKLIPEERKKVAGISREDMKRRARALINALGLRRGTERLFLVAVGQLRMTDAVHKEILKDILAVYDEEVELAGQQREAYTKMQAEAEKEKATIDQKEIDQMRSFTDTKSKLQYLLRNCDLLVVPRVTWQAINYPNPWGVPNWYHEPDQAQIDAFAQYLRGGKPILAAMGPYASSWREELNPGRRIHPQYGFVVDKDPKLPRRFEKLLGNYGFKLDSRLVLFDDEMTSFESRERPQFAGVSVPPLAFEDPKPSGDGAARPNPIAHSLGALASARDLPVTIKARHPRVVRYEPPGTDLGYSPYFAWTDAKSWGETQPFIKLEDYLKSRRGGGPSNYVPKYDPKVAFDAGKKDSEDSDKKAKKKLPAKKDERGPFPIGAAVEAKPIGLFSADIPDLLTFCSKLRAESRKKTPSPAKRLWTLLPDDAQTAVEHAALGLPPTKDVMDKLVAALNGLLGRRDLYEPRAFAGVAVPQEASKLLDRRAKLADKDVHELNRMLIEAAYPQSVTRIPRPIPPANDPGKKEGKEELKPAALLRVHDWAALCTRLYAEGSARTPSPGRRIWELLSTDAQDAIKDAADTEKAERLARARIVDALDEILADADFYQAAAFSSVDLPEEASELLDRKRDLEGQKKAVPEAHVRRLNLLLLRAAFPQEIADRPSTRLAVLGKARLITGEKLDPDNEKLFITLVNWLLRRDYLLGLKTTEWAYPRMEIGEQPRDRWLWFLRLGMPVLCAFAGAVVLMYRRVH